MIPVRLTVRTPQRGDAESSIAFEVPRHPTSRRWDIIPMGTRRVKAQPAAEEFTIRYDLSFEFDNGDEKPKLSEAHHTSLSPRRAGARFLRAALRRVSNPYADFVMFCL
jgi:hypothetical protein